MNRLLTLLLALAALVTAATPAAAATLRSEIVINGSQIRLGDLFAGLAPQASLQTVATAPGEGGRVVLDPEWIVRVARAYGVDWQPGYRVPTVTIRRADADERAAAETAVRMALTRVILAGAEMPAEDDAAGDDAAADLATTVVAELEIPVLAQRIRPGEVIGANDIAWRSLPESRLDDSIVTDADELLGMSVRRALSADQPVRAGDLRLPVIVPRGTTVSMVLESPGLHVTARGRALEDGALGQTVRIVNVDSNRTVDAVVIGAGAVAIRSPALF